MSSSPLPPPKKTNKVSITFVEDGKEVSKPYSFFTGEDDSVDVGKYGVYFFARVKNGFPMGVYDKATLKITLGDRTLLEDTRLIDVTKLRSCTFEYINRLNRKNRTSHIPLLMFTLP